MILGDDCKFPVYKAEVIGSSVMPELLPCRYELRNHHFEMFLEQWFSTRVILLPGDIWQC